MPKIEDKKVEVVIKEKQWTQEELLKLDNEADIFREETEIKGKKIRYLSRRGVLAFLKSKGVLSQFSTLNQWIVKIGGFYNANGDYVITSNDYPDLMKGISLITKMHANEPATR